MDGDASQFVADELALAGVQAGPHGDPHILQGIPHGQCAANPAGRAVEGGEEAIARRVDLAAALAGENVAHGGVMARGAPSLMPMNGALRAGRVHDGTDVVHALLERADGRVV